MTTPPTGPAPAQQGKGVAHEPTSPSQSHPRDSELRHEGSDAHGGLLALFSPSLLLALAALAAIAPLAMDSYLPSFAQIATDLGASASTVQLTLTAFLVGVALGQLTIGVLSDRLGRRPLLLWGSVLAFVAGVCTALAPSVGMLIAARFFQGLGGAAGMVLGRAVISDRSRGITAAQALSVVMAIQGIAPVIAPLLGGALLGIGGWRLILGVIAVFQGLLVLVVTLWVPETLPPDERRGGGLVVLVEGGRSLVRDGVFVRLILINALVYALLTAYLAAAPFILQNVLGMGTATYSGVFALCGVTITGTVSACGSLAGRVSPERQVRVGLVVMIVVDGALGAYSMTALAAPRESLLVGTFTVVLLVLDMVCIGTCIGNLPAISLGRCGAWVGAGSALLGFAQFVAGGIVSPLVGLSGEASGFAFGVAVVVIIVLANVLALPGLRDRGEKERLVAQRAEQAGHRLGR